MYHSGQKVCSGLFSHESHRSVVDDYMKNLKIFSECRWKLLLTACSIVKVENPVTLSTGRARPELWRAGPALIGSRARDLTLALPCLRRDPKGNIYC